MMEMTMSEQKHYYPSIWLSDIHLGCKDCKADFLLRYLDSIECDRIFLVGDIVDFWALRRRMHWPDSHNQVLNLLLKKAQDGTEVIYLPGNHDGLMKPYEKLLFGSIEIHNEYIYQTISGKKLLMLHGDKYDSQVCFGRWQAKIGDLLYDVLLWLNRTHHKLRKLLGQPYWSLASYIKTRVKKANEAIARYKDAAVEDAKKQGADGIVCGHIHHPQLCLERGIVYCNDGDWIENCTSMVETKDGNLRLLKWRDGIHDTEIIAQMNWGNQSQAQEDKDTAAA